VADGGGGDSMLRFQLERGDNMTKHYRKMKRSQRARLGFIGRKYDMTWWRDDVGRMRGDTRERKGRRKYQLG
jgi:hypothetical protein